MPALAHTVYLALLLMLSALVIPGCGTATAEEPLTPSWLLAEINRERQLVGLGPLAFHPVLLQVAQQRAEELAASGALSADAERSAAPNPVVKVSRHLLSRGYRAATWSENSFWGGKELLRTWREEHAESWRATVLGDFAEIGIGVTRTGGEPLYAFLFAQPRRVVFERRAAPLRDLSVVRSRMLAAVNEHRRQAGRSPLNLDPRLDAVAQAHAEDMLRRGFYAHRNPDGKLPADRLRRAAYRYERSGENIAKGLFGATEVVDRWMNSSGHRSNILGRRFTRLGIGVAVGTAHGDAAEAEVLWVQVFAQPR